MQWRVITGSFVIFPFPLLDRQNTRTFPRNYCDMFVTGEHWVRSEKITLRSGHGLAVSRWLPAGRRDFRSKGVITFTLCAICPALLRASRPQLYGATGARNSNTHDASPLVMEQTIEPPIPKLAPSWYCDPVANRTQPRTAGQWIRFIV